MLILAVLYCQLASKFAFSFEAFPQPKGMLFLNPYVGYSWYNRAIGGGKFNENEKISQAYGGLFFEYGLTKKITIGADITLAETWTSVNGRLSGRVAEKSFALSQIQLLARYNLFRDGGSSISVATYLFTPSFGYGTGILDTYGSYNQWKHEISIEFGYKFKTGGSITANFEYRAQYNNPQNRDVMRFKLTYYRPIAYGFSLYATLVKQAYINKGNNVFGFAQNGSFRLEAFDFITNGGYVALDLFLAKEITKGKYIVFAYTRSLQSKIFANKGMNMGFNAFWIEAWFFIK